jgi:hypothetical protein
VTWQEGEPHAEYEVLVDSPRQSYEFIEGGILQKVLGKYGIYFDHNRRNTKEVHQHWRTAKYVFPTAGRVDDWWYHDHDVYYHEHRGMSRTSLGKHVSERHGDQLIADEVVHAHPFEWEPGDLAPPPEAQRTQARGELRWLALPP